MGKGRTGAIAQQLLARGRPGRLKHGRARDAVAGGVGKGAAVGKVKQRQHSEQGVAVERTLQKR